ncbi:MAG: chloride channel protein [Anaerolineae bacterium]|nr:chloride channel protein [Anaerolineae bacterium]
MGTALLVGLGTGLGAVAFRWLIRLFQWVFFEVGGQVFAFMGDYMVLVIPILGGLIGGPIIYFFAREAKGHGVPEVMEAVALRGGRIRPRVAVVKALASSICLGSGGSVGSEGPIVQIGSALGSTVGQMLHLSDERIRSLVACGAAGGISAVFNAPIAGTIFALEVILGEFRSSYFGSVVISAVLSDVVMHAFFGAERAFAVPAYELVTPAELLLYALLGLLTAPFSVLYTKTVDGLEDVFDHWKSFPGYLKTAVGGLGVGIIGVLLVAGANAWPDSGLAFSWPATGGLMPSAFGAGYELVNPALLGTLSLGTALVLIVAKLLTTGLTLGSGGSGGIFAPALFIGSMVGMAFGLIANSVFPGQIGPAGAYALVGMAAFFAGTAHAPATAILILFEMTGDYNIILPLMFATVISLIVSRTVEPESIYTGKLAKRGIRLRYGRDVDLMEGVTVGEVMDTQYDTVPPTMTVMDLIETFERTHHHGFPVVDENEKLVGIVTVTDLDHAAREGTLDGLTVRDIATMQGLLTTYPDESLGTAMLRLGMRGVGRLPVVSREDPGRFVGMVRRDSLVRAYSRAISRRTNIAHRLNALQQYGSGDVSVVEVCVTPGMECAGMSMREFAATLPEACIVASIVREGRITIPHGNTQLQEGDQVTLLVRREYVAAVHEAFC